MEITIRNNQSLCSAESESMQHCVGGELQKLQHCNLQRKSSNTLTREQVFNRIRHCRKRTKTLLNRLEPLNGLSTPICELMTEAVREETCCIKLVRDDRQITDGTRRVRRLEKLLGSSCDLLLHQEDENGSERMAKIEQLAGKLRRHSQSSTSQSDDACSAHTKKIVHRSNNEVCGGEAERQPICELEQLIEAEKETWKELREHAKREENTRGQTDRDLSWHSPSKNGNEETKASGTSEISSSSVVQQERNLKPDVCEPTTTSQLYQAGRLWEGSLPEATDESSRLDTLRWLQNDGNESRGCAPMNLVTDMDQSRSSNGPEPPLNDGLINEPQGDNKILEKTRIDKKVALDKGVDLLRKLGRGELSIPDVPPSSATSCIRSSGGTERGEDNDVLRDLRYARCLRCCSPEERRNLDAVFGDPAGPAGDSQQEHPYTSSEDDEHRSGDEVSQWSTDSDGQQSTPPSSTAGPDQAFNTGHA